VEIWSLSRGEKKTKNENNCTKGLKHKCMGGFTLRIDLVIICLPKVTRSRNRCHSPLLSYLSFSYCSLLTSNVFNDGGLLWKGVMETLYVKYVEFKLCLKAGKTKKGNNYPRDWSTRAWPGSHMEMTCLLYVFQK